MKTSLVLFIALALTLLTWTVACNRGQETANAPKPDSIGISLQGRDGLPSLEMALDILEQADSKSFVQGFASAVAQARAACPEQAGLIDQATPVLTIEFVIENSRISMSVPPEIDHPFAVCIIKALDGKGVDGVGTETLAATMQVKVEPDRGASEP